MHLQLTRGNFRRPPQTKQERKFQRVEPTAEEVQKQVRETLKNYKGNQTKVKRVLNIEKTKEINTVNRLKKIKNNKN